MVGFGVLQNAVSPIFPTDFKIPDVLNGATTRVFNVRMYVAKVYSDNAESPRVLQSENGSLNFPLSC